MDNLHGEKEASEGIGGVQFRRFKIVIGDSGTDGGDVSTLNPIPVVLTGGSPTGGLTNTELRATPVPVLFSSPQHIIVDSMPAGASGLTDTELRASAVPISSTNLDVALSTRLKAADTLAGVTAVGSITNALPAGSNVIGHVIHDTGSTTAVTGNVTVVQGTGTNLHVVVDSAPTTAVTLASLPSLAAGSAVIGHVIVDTAPTTAVTGPVTDAQLRASAVTVTANAGTSLNTSALALEAGGNLALAAAYLLAIGNQNANIVTATQTTASGVKAEDTTAADGDFGSANLAVRQDFPLTDTTANGGYAWMKTDAQGRLWVNSDSSSGLLQQSVDMQKFILAEMRIQTLVLQLAFNIPDDMNSFRNDPNITLQ